jgi:FtsZ-binding cell division protein ZapB
MIWVLKIIDVIMNNKIVQAIGGVVLLLLGAKVWSEKQKRKGAEEQMAKHEKQRLEDNERVRDKYDRIQKSQIKAANARPLSNSDAAKRLRDNNRL